MRFSGWVLTSPFALLVGSAPAQLITRLYDCSQPLAAFEEQSPRPPTEGTGFDERLVRVLTALVRQQAAGVQAGAAARAQVRLQRPGRLFVRGNAEQCQLVEAALQYLDAPDLNEVCVQCTLVTMPAKTATEFGLRADAPRPVAVAEAGRLLKLALQQGGTVSNLPETSSLPLQPFVGGGQQAKGHPAKQLRVCGEALQVGEREAVITVHLAQGDQPADRTKPPTRSLVSATMHLRVGDGLLLTSLRGNQATVLWLWFTDLRPRLQARGG